MDPELAFTTAELPPRALCSGSDLSSPQLTPELLYLCTAPIPGGVLSGGYTCSVSDSVRKSTVVGYCRHGCSRALLLVRPQMDSKRHGKNNALKRCNHECRAYYGSTGVGLRGHQHHQGWEFHTGRLIEACLAKASASGRKETENVVLLGRSCCRGVGE